MMSRLSARAAAFAAVVTTSLVAAANLVIEPVDAPPAPAIVLERVVVNGTRVAATPANTVVAATPAAEPSPAPMH